MKKSEEARRNVSIRSIIIAMALVTMVISALLLTATYYTDAGYTRLSENMDATYSGRGTPTTCRTARTT